MPILGTAIMDTDRIIPQNGSSPGSGGSSNGGINSNIPQSSHMMHNSSNHLPQSQQLKLYPTTWGKQWLPASTVRKWSHDCKHVTRRRRDGSKSLPNTTSRKRKCQHIIHLQPQCDIFHHDRWCWRG